MPCRRRGCWSSGTVTQLLLYSQSFLLIYLTFLTPYDEVTRLILIFLFLVPVNLFCSHLSVSLGVCWRCLVVISVVAPAA